MEDRSIHGHRKGLACRPSLLFSSPSTKFLLCLVPLVVVYGFASILGPKASSWEFLSNHPRLWSEETSIGYSTSGDSSLISTESSDAREEADSHAKEKGDNLEEPNALPNDSLLIVNRSSSSPLDVEPNKIQERNATEKEEDDSLLQISRNESEIRPTADSKNKEPLNLPKNATIQKQDTNLKRLEASLQKSRAAIKDAKTGNQTEDPDYVPMGPMYWNARVFHRSYLEMERQFKVFVYEEGEPPIFHNGPCKSIYAMEGNFIHMMEVHDQFRTRDPEKAHVYFLPFSVAMMVHYVYVRDSHDFSPIKRTVTDYVNLVALKYPYWNRSLGADHFMLACHDWGPETSFSIPHLARNSIRVLCNANTSEKFNPIKDVSFPEINLITGTIEGFIGGPSPSKRPILAFFAGGLHGPIRPILFEQWENKDEDVKVYRYLPRGVSYIEMMRKTKFCICPSGYEVASPRVVEAIYAGCVPVLMSDHYVPPFSDVLNWKSFSVEVPVSEIPNLKRILTSISPRQYIRMQRRGLQIRRHFEVNSPPKRFDVFHMILHSVWLRRLNVRIHADRTL